MELYTDLERRVVMAVDAAFDAIFIQIRVGIDNQIAECYNEWTKPVAAVNSPNMDEIWAITTSMLINETKSARGTDSDGSENKYFHDQPLLTPIVWAEIKAKDTDTIITRFINTLTFDRVESLPASRTEEPEMEIYRRITKVHEKLVELVYHLLSIITGPDRTRQLCMSMYYLFRAVEWFVKKGETNPDTILESIKNSRAVSVDKAIDIVKDEESIKSFISGCLSLSLITSSDIKVCIEGIGGYTDWRDDEVYYRLEPEPKYTDNTFPDNVYVIVFPGITVREYVIAKAAVVYNSE